MDETLSRQIDAFIEENKDRILWDMTRLVGVPSVEGPAEEDAPFGPGPRKALDMALTIARELELGTEDLDHKIGYAYVGGKGEKYLATICHVDVVPIGNGWNTDPWTLTEREGYLIGRGIVDDKGPAVLTLYALKFLQEHGGALRYPVRAILGSNEETGMLDVKRYNETEPAPLFCFSPDAEFPLINGEKGIVHGRIRSLCKMEKIVDIKGGAAYNAVPDKAEVWIQAGSVPAQEGLDIEEARFGVWHITAHGIGGHAASPQGTVSAIGILEDYLLENHLVSEAEEEFLRFAVKVPHASDGSLLGVAADDGLFSPLTVVSGMIYGEDDRLVQTLDFRFPTNTSAARLQEILEKEAAGVAAIELDEGKAPFYKDPNEKELKACMDAFREVTGSEKKPFTIGGGTYARSFPNAVGFGPEHLDRVRPAFVGPIHGANEAGHFGELLEAMKVYIAALMNLEELEF
ncbi:MAG: Sapep family Mn(2+)-dependent dipeptidase [Lachnospiraceae bacterium]|nr:Sapep family Mn(2+)-dependent dipeptidase [Lachnospiraceae bacterium]